MALLLPFVYKPKLMTHTEFELAILYTNRQKLKEIIEQLPEQKLLHIPAGFSNNVLWQIGHIVVSNQRLIYMRSGLPLHISDTYNNNFKIGSDPKKWTATPDIQEVKDSLITTIDRLKEDLGNKIFKSYEAFKSSGGFMISNHLEALTYANTHEAEHTGSLKYLIKVVG